MKLPFDLSAIQEPPILPQTLSRDQMEVDGAQVISLLSKNFSQ